MISLAPSSQVYIGIDPIDFRYGIDRLARVCVETFEVDPFAGAVFVFRNRRGTAARLFFYDSSGFWMATKRLSSGRFRWWNGTEATKSDLRELMVILWNGDPNGVFQSHWLPPKDKSPQ